MNSNLPNRILSREGGICLYGVVPPKVATPQEKLKEIIAQQYDRFASMDVDGLIVYDIQDEAARNPEPRPFPFLPTIDPETYAYDLLRDLKLPKIVYRRVARDATEDRFVAWLNQTSAADELRMAVLVGAPTRHEQSGLTLDRAYELVKEHRPKLVLGGIAIAERHARRGNEHERIISKTEAGCAFFVTQAVYDLEPTLALFTDYRRRIDDFGWKPVPIILTFSPCGSEKTLEFMKWLGISFPEALERELREAKDPLETSIDVCERIFSEAWDFAREKRLPIGVNVESVSIRRVEIEASLELLSRLRRRLAKAA